MLSLCLSRSYSSIRGPHQLYTPLKENQIRLLRLHAGTPDSQIACQLHIVDLLAYEDIAAESKIEGWERFDAISYVWGDRKQVVEISCASSISPPIAFPALISPGDGVSISVTANLVDALRRFRDPLRAQIIWADALCINQRDNYERAAQVKLMGLIYFKARRVRVWLGQDNEIEEQYQVHHAIQLIKEYSRLYESCRPDPGGQKLGVLSKGLFKDPESMQRSHWASLRRLLERPWFTRVWVVQELGLSRYAEFYCGTYTFNRNELDNFERVLMHSKTGLSIWNDLDLQIIHLGEDYWRSAWSNIRIELGEDAQEAETFFDILRSARGLQCTERKDLIYAFLGHPSAFKRQLCDVDPYFWYPTNYYQNRRTIIAPNYSTSYRFPELCKDLAFAAIKEFNIGLNVLASIAHSERTIDLKVASWIPRWDLMDKPAKFLGSGIYYAASKGLSNTAFTIRTSRISPMRPKLSFKALRLGTIWVALRPPTTVTPEHLAKTLAELLGDIPRRGDVSYISPPSISSYPYEDAFLTALATTMTAGLTSGPDMYAVPADEHTDHHLNTFKAYYRRQQAIDEDRLPNPEDDEAADFFAGELNRAARWRVVFLTRNGRFGLGPVVSDFLDEVWLPMGAKMPFVLRPTGRGTYKLLGQVFIYGIMRGEAVQGRSEVDFESVVLE
ncbi:uncharacterized protein M421DRAFT_426919 [Didymella exigua CBS 183.55]|uniref:Heterokaryon incompatibility domain-containing protein n=1 Tax=Didymella exigua CBS 183.55 TaxID=1150837 RepID=A0A6A5R6Q6_9PLEO|nr:uncharacterized protein M421DRAFT_426919 [Didymella exigua CBS 183.55]KAF1922416.1 hypothetical protein M421DRAFT_426919 [Didymella exigua CBS 183.55]